MSGLQCTLLGIGIAALAVISACVTQRRLLFPAPIIAGGALAAPDPDVTRIWLGSEGAQAEAFYLPPHRASERPGPLVLYAHGNGELIDYWVREFDVPRAWGASILLVEYPGYGRSPGKPSQSSITRVLVSAYDWAASQPQIDRERIIGYGRSLGGGAICALALQRPLAALVLESTFTSVKAMARELYGVPGLLVRDPFDNLESVRAFRGPILLLHGERDAAIPVDHARRLHAAAPDSELHLMACGHNDCPRPWATLSGFLGRHDLL
jgi:hypothetical protein